MAPNPAWFDEEYYLKSKLKQLQKTEPDAGWTMPDLWQALSKAGLTPLAHFEAYGLQERTSPNPSFNAYEYLHAKLKQLQEKQEGNYQTIDEVAEAIQDSGLSLWGHFHAYGWKEGVNPSNNFDIEGYFEAKLAQLQATDPDGQWDMEKLKDTFANVGLDPISHYSAYGKDEPGVTPVAVSEADRVPADPNPVDPVPEPGPGPEPEPGPVPGPGPGPGPEPDPTLIHLKTLTEEDLNAVNGTAGSDIFVGDSSATVRGGALDDDGKPLTGLVLDGKGGSNLLSVTLDQPIAHPSYAPTISNVQTISLRAQNKLDANHDDIGMMFTRVSGLETLQNSGSTANLTATDVRNKVLLSVDNMAADGPRDFAVRYGENVDAIGNQALYLRDAHVNLLTVTKLKLDGTYQNQSAGIHTLDIYAHGFTTHAGNNSIASFDEKDGTSSIGEASLAATLREINVTGEGSLSLNLAEIKTLAKKDSGGASERIDTDLSKFNIGTGDLVQIKLADLANGHSGPKTDLGDGKTQANSKSNHTIELGKELDGGSHMIIENMTIASTSGYTHQAVHNDVLVIADWEVSGATALADLITTFTVSTGAALSDTQSYVNFEIGFGIDGGDPETGFTLTLTNIVSENVYNKMLQALDTVTSNGFDDTTKLIDFTDDWVNNGDLYQAFNTTMFADGSITLSGEHGEAAAAIIGLTGILVNEGTFILNDLG